MLRSGPPPLCRILAPAIGLLLFGGCGPTDISPTSRESEVDASQPRPLDEFAGMTARRINDSYIVPVSFPITPLPPVDAEESVLPSNEADGIAPTQPADNSLPPLGPALSSDRGLDVDDEARGAPKPEFSSIDDGETPQARDIKPSNPNATNQSPHQEESTTLPPKFAAAYAVRPRGPHATNDGVDELSGPSEPTAELIAVARQADTHIARGFKSADRGRSTRLGPSSCRRCGSRPPPLMHNDRRRPTVGRWSPDFARSMKFKISFRLTARSANPSRSP